MQPQHFDPQAVLADLLGSSAALHAVLGIFPTWHESTLADLRAADETGDRARLRQLAHGVRGALLQLHAYHGAALAGKLEQSCIEQVAATPEPALIILQDELAAIRAEVRLWLEHNPIEPSTSRPSQ